MTLADIHAEAIAEFDEIQPAVRPERMLCLRDRRNYSIPGALWEDELGKQFENKPKFEFNKLHLAVIRIVSEYRNNRITVDFVSKDGAENDKLADTCDGLYRADEQDSVANEAYDNAYEESVGGGMGAWRLRTCYEDDEDEDDDRQRIRMEPIYDADSCVFFDLQAKRQDKADARRCFVLTSMTPSAYKDLYNDDPTTWDKLITQTQFDWSTENTVYVAEYYRVEEKSEVLRVFKGLLGDEKKVYEAEYSPEYGAELKALGYKETRKKKIKKREVHKYILSGSKVVEDCGVIAGKNIPIIVTYGKRWYVDNVERCMGHPRLATDAVRLLNMQMSKLAEISALSTVEKPIFTPEQVVGHTQMWSEDNIKNNPYLLVNPITDASGNPTAVGPQSYTRVPQIPPAMAALLQLTEGIAAELLGNNQAGEEIQANVSGKAVELVQNRLDMQTFIYMSNFAKAMRRSGEVWLSMMKDIAVEKGRKMKTLSADGKAGMVELAKPMYDDKLGAYLENDLSQANFDVVSDVGPSSQSRRGATVRALTGMMSITQDPDTMSVLSATAMMNMEGEGIGETRDYFRKKLVRMGAVTATDEEMKAMEEERANTPPDPNAQYLEAESKKAVALASKAEADTLLTMAKTEQTQADTQKTVSQLSIDEQKHLIETVNALDQSLVANTQQV